MDRELGLASYHDQRREIADVVKELTIIHAARLRLAYETYKIYESVNVTTPVVLDEVGLVLTPTMLPLHERDARQLGYSAIPSR